MSSIFHAISVKKTSWIKLYFFIFVFTYLAWFFVIETREDENLVAAGKKEMQSKNLTIKPHLWCTIQLCTDEAIRQEMEKRKISSSNFSNHSFKDKLITFNSAKLYESAFSYLFYLEPRVLYDQPLIVVTTSYGFPPRYSLDWINAQPWPVFISTKELGFGISSEPWGNVGQEISSYMRFILMFWDYLPEFVAFVHGHEKTWHQEGYTMSYMLRNICLGKYQYFSLNAYESESWRPIKGSQGYYRIIRKYWKLVEPYLGPLPKKGFKEKCCAQFVVSRRRIIARPRELYELILKQMSDPRKNYGRAQHGKNAGWDLIHFWEAIWHYIMGESAIVDTRKKYGYGKDVNRDNKKFLSKKPERTLKNVIACPYHESKNGA